MAIAATLYFFLFMEISKFTRHDFPTASSWLVLMHSPPGATSTVWTATGFARVKASVACVRSSILGASLLSSCISCSFENLAHCDQMPCEFQASPCTRPLMQVKRGSPDG